MSSLSGGRFNSNHAIKLVYGLWRWYGRPPPRFVDLVLERSEVVGDADLDRWRQTHANTAFRALAAGELMRRNGVDTAMAILELGLPGDNEGYETGTGELDNAQLRHLLVSAAYRVLQEEPLRAFDLLSRFFVPGARATWFGELRARLVLSLLLGQLGASDATWLSLMGRDLRERWPHIDPRWRAVCHRLEAEGNRLAPLGNAVRTALERCGHVA